MSEDVSRFLEQVKELGDRRIEEDEKRSRELEEKILQEKAERQARRRERARSISPQKSSPANTPPPSSHRLNLDSSPVLEPLATPQSQSQSQSSPQSGFMAGRPDLSTSPTKENESPIDAENKSPTRTDTVARGLAWQRRPTSQASDRSRSRPLSMVAVENLARTSTTTPSEPASATASATETVSRDSIASALSAKDPAWFRQTADRGANSAAYRKSQVEDDQKVDLSTASHQLPGMSPGASHRSTTNTTTNTNVTPDEAVMPPPESPASRNKLAPPISLTDTPKLDPPTTPTPSQLDTDTEAGKQGTMMDSPSGRTSPSRSERPVSPTKGMGGFVQSAMMKRSDSVSKRWSVQSPTSFQRGNPLAAKRGSVDLSGQLGIATRPRPGSISRDISIGPPSRPDSSQDLVPAQGDEAPPVDAKESQEPAPEPTALPISPSKTMDPRRWSPTKSSWLESALNKPESPKPKTASAVPNQPAWMVEIQKAKAQKAADPNNPNTERTRSPTISHKHQVSIGGLMRSSAPGVGVPAKPDSLSGFSSPTVATFSPTGSVFSHARKDSQATSIVADDKVEAEPARDRRPTLSSSVSDMAPPPPASDKGESSPSDQTKPDIKTKSDSKLDSKPDPKPDTVPVKDFRAHLKHRQTPSTSATSGPENEFKNVFGNLRKTTTQHYKAPDELKDNIAKGKAALNSTGGPQKTERKDEFKESLLAKKKSFHQIQSEGRGVARTSSNASESPVPEGLVKRVELQRTGTFKKDSAAPEAVTVDTKRSNTVSKPDPSPISFKKDSAAPEGVTVDTKRSNTVSKPDPSPVASTKPEWANLHRKKSSIHEPTAPKPADEPSSSSTTAPVRVPGKLSSNLANRFNPALAGLLARGPPGPSGASGGGVSGIPAAKTPLSSSATATTPSEAGSGPKLTHMTKNRARGPKRKAPTSVAAAAPAPKGPEPNQANQPSTAPKPISTKEEPSAAPTSQARPLPISTTNEEVPFRRPSPSKEPGSSSKIHEQVAAFAALRKQQPSPTKTSPTKETSEPEPVESRAPTPKKLDTKRMSKFFDQASQPPLKSPGPEPSKETKQASSPPPESSLEKPPSPEAPKTQPQPSPPKEEIPPKTSSPVISPRTAEPTANNNQPAQSSPRSSGNALFGARPLPTTPKKSSQEGSRPTSRQLPQEPPKPSPPQAKPSPPQPEPKLSSPMASPPLRSPTQPESSGLEEFFGTDRPKRNYHADAAEILMRRPPLVGPSIHTITAQLFQFAPDGKKVRVPSHQERTLFEREMYLCFHVFNNEAGKKTTEVYFWAGDEVSPAEVEDASIFVSKEAKAVGGKVVKLQQSKETPEFLQALGGIVVTQRGSGNKYDSLAPHMLCGRRHLGHVVFDEVDFSPSSLCSGFPYLVTQAGRCYLWKGKGSGVDELSCARLIGMDFALSGEMTEIEDGQEPDEFWGLFNNGGGGGSKSASADHWRLKPNYEKYCSRLFYSDAASKEQIIELSPFSQGDLAPHGIYVLDAFFEMYVIVGARAQSQYASFHNALDFAQEYAILAAGMEDRPFVPISTVVLEGIPRDLKSVFRKWRDAESPTLMVNSPVASPASASAGASASGQIKRGRSLRVMPLSQALQALSA